jgi:hypothetical protein
MVRNDHEINRQVKGIGLILDELPADAVHGDTVIGLADAGDEFDDLDVGMALAGVMQSEGTVFAPTPEQGGFLACVHGIDR